LQGDPGKNKLLPTQSSDSPSATALPSSVTFGTPATPLQIPQTKLSGPIINATMFYAFHPDLVELEDGP